MLMLPEMLVSAARQAGMKIPPDLYDYSKEKFPHFHVFEILQLGRRMRPGEQFDNAKVLMNLTEEQIKTFDLEDFIKAGFAWQQ